MSAHHFPVDFKNRPFFPLFLRWHSFVDSRFSLLSSLCRFIHLTSFSETPTFRATAVAQLLFFSDRCCWLYFSLRLESLLRLRHIFKITQQGCSCRSLEPDRHANWIRCLHYRASCVQISSAMLHDISWALQHYLPVFVVP